MGLARGTAVRRPGILAPNDLAPALGTAALVGRRSAAKARSMCGPTVTVIGSIPVSDCWMRDTGPLFRVGEGGGIEYDGDGTLMATESCWLNSNRNPGKSRSQVEAELLARFGATKMIWLPGVTGWDVTDGHIDGTARYIKPGVVMVQLAGDVRPDVWTPNAQAVYNVLPNATDARGRRLQVLTIEGPDTLPRVPSGKRADFLSSYMNWTVTNSAVIITQFGDTAKDAAAKAAISAAYGRPVVQLNLDNLYGNGGGGAHCVTMQEPTR
ncbi:MULTISPECIES: agmatine/peptidylarginine deiminase [Streptomyces]|uniref:agmatine deiminase family protein n=1 Tax=Streptomyces TaxID=1883 RepID=UPI001CC234BC|nr:agmatine deiminase family protein [Streptomyces venezuelae]